MTESKLDRAGSTASLALEQGGSVLLDEMRIGCRALTAFDVGVHVIRNGPLDTLWRDSPFEPGSWPITGTRRSQFVENVLINVIFITIHH